MAARKDHRQLRMVPWVCLWREAWTPAAPYSPCPPLDTRPRADHLPDLRRMGDSVPSGVVGQERFGGRVAGGFRERCHEFTSQADANICHGSDGCYGRVPFRHEALGDCYFGYSLAAFRSFRSFFDWHLRGAVDLGELGFGESSLSAVCQAEVTQP